MGRCAANVARSLLIFKKFLSETGNEVKEIPSEHEGAGDTGGETKKV